MTISPSARRRAPALQRSRPVPRRAGFTLLEMLLAVAIMLIVFGLALPFFRAQIEAMTAHAGRFDAQQNARFGAATLDRELRVAGAGLPPAQPMLVQADPFAVTFNADLAARDSLSGVAFTPVYFDPDLPPGATSSMTPSAPVILPLSSISYPSASYTVGGLASPGETVSFWVAPDTTPGGNGRSALYRRVNDLAPSIVARGLRMRSSDPPTFTYFKVDAGTGAPVALAANVLPVYHVPQHGAPADTGRAALADSIRSVHVFLRGLFVGARGDSAERVVETDIRLLNSGLLKLPTCGEAPVFNQSATATFTSTPQRGVAITWNPATDEGSGEKDVERYVVWRRPASGSFTDPLASIPAGQSSYQFFDSTVSTGQYVYGVAAQDCGSQLSGVTSSNQVQVN